ncbi:mechanosensitive ion channel domain-containing protein [Methanolobus sp. ZRKC5]|uniref:mechanosensitive ion channel family protein n=1 Tax=unclassified Methanolobus TaxID=2629569 RepID=UPI00313DD72E
MDIEQFIPSIISLIVTISLVLLFDFLFRKRKLFSREKVIQQLIFVVILVIGMLFIIFTLPISVEDKNLILTFLGLVIGAIITFSSTTFVTNAMAGIMLRLINPFRVGDYIKIDDTFGRVTEMYFLHTQVQSMDRDLITIPNAKLVSNPLKTIRSSGTIITTSVSLGYNIPRKDIEKDLLKAAEITGLENSFVHIEKLGDFSITYKVGGLLKDIEGLITARSDFKKNVMDTLHDSEIEIVSPTYMNQRVFSEDYVCLPPKETKTKAIKIDSELEIVPEFKTEEIIFDKAITAQMLDRIYITSENLAPRRKDMEEKLKQINDENARNDIKEQLTLLALKEEGIKTLVQELKTLPDITAMSDENKDVDVEGMLNTEKDVVELADLHSNVEKMIENILKKQQ